MHVSILQGGACEYMLSQQPELQPSGERASPPPPPPPPDQESVHTHRLTTARADRHSSQVIYI